jgi:hypothetical protein
MGVIRMAYEMIAIMQKLGITPETPTDEAIERCKRELKREFAREIRNLGVYIPGSRIFEYVHTDGTLEGTVIEFYAIPSKYGKAVGSLYYI